MTNKPVKLKNRSGDYLYPYTENIPTASTSTAGKVKLDNSPTSGSNNAITSGAVHTALAAKLDANGTAAKATADAEGNNIASTYLKKTEEGKGGLNLLSNQLLKAFAWTWSQTLQSGTVFIVYKQTGEMTNGVACTSYSSDPGYPGNCVIDGKLYSINQSTGALTQLSNDTDFTFAGYGNAIKGGKLYSFFKNAYTSTETGWTKISNFFGIRNGALYTFNNQSTLICTCLDSGGVWTDINSGSNDSGYCAGIRDGYEMQNGTCVKKVCPAGQYGDGETCFSCPEHATSLAGSLLMTACYCEEDYIWGTDDKCHAKIEHCSLQTDDTCTKCETGYKVSNGSCIESDCSAYPLTFSPENCATVGSCEDGSTTYYRCENCNTNYILNTETRLCYAKVAHCARQETASCDVCEENYVEYNGQCYAEIQNCTDQRGDTCFGCADNYDLSNNTCVASNCSVSAYPLTTEPKHCDTALSCTTGSGLKRYRCETCTSGYSIQNGKCYADSKCPADIYIYDSVPSCPTGYAYTSCVNESNITSCKYGDQTLYTCATCNTGYTGEKCDSCASGYDKYGTGTCGRL